MKGLSLSSTSAFSRPFVSLCWTKALREQSCFRAESGWFPLSMLSRRASTAADRWGVRTAGSEAGREQRKWDGLKNKTSISWVLQSRSLKDDHYLKKTQSNNNITKVFEFIIYYLKIFNISTVYIFLFKMIQQRLFKWFATIIFLIHIL